MFKGHPKGLLAAALSNMGERFGYYLMNAVLLLFLVSKFDDAVGDAPCLLRCEFESEFFEIFEYVGLARVFAKGIFAFASEAFG